jgi:CRP-like cAMP-binding protein
MIERLFEDISRVIPLSESDKACFAEHVRYKKLKKKQFLIQEGFLSLHTGYVAKGCLRSYTVHENGSEHIFQFAIEGWWMGDMYSFLTGEPATMNIEALEDSELIVMDLASRERIFEQVPKFERFMRILLEKNYIANQRRVNAMLGQTAEERYRAYINKYPQIVQRVPQHMIASYLGITPETLSRVRKREAK